MSNLTMEKLVNISKQYGFIFQGSEIYDGLANTWDYGPLGVELKNNVKKAWWKKFIQERRNSYGLDASILMNPKVWEASGHIASFDDPLMDCKKCKMRYRADNLIEEHSKDNLKVGAMTNDEMVKYIYDNKIVCPKCGALDYTDIRQFNLMFKTFRGVTEDSNSIIYLRPENAQGEYVNFLNVQRSLRAKIPFGIGQIGKAFRNEITPGNFTFRTIEFEQMEYQWFCKKGEDENFYNEFKQFGNDFFVALGLPQDKLRFKDHDKLAHYAKAAVDIEYLFPFGWGEINGTHNRTDFDLTRHQEYAKKSMEYLDPETNEKFIPYVIESTYGADRVPLAILAEAYNEETLPNGEIREVLKLNAFLAPYKVAVLPLIKKAHQDKALELYDLLSKQFMCSYDDTANIGKRYRRQDAVGTPLCITIDDNTLNNDTVTVRDRDTMEQITLKISELNEYITKRIAF
ncbi:MAG: glycine--tRNA ligase [Bacilli bacterium]|nr:glycine--tRNA ligase [Bacilli bacterium]